MSAADQEVLQNELKRKHICRFCLSQDVASLTNIFFRDTRIKSSAPLPIQVMAIASIEVFTNDGMPSYVCSDCISMFEYSYQFKQMCKKADNLLRQYPLVGIWPKSLERPTMPQALPSHSVAKQNNRITQTRAQPPKQNVTNESLLLPKKILNVNSEAKAQTVNISNAEKLCVTKVEKTDDECSMTYLEKIDNNDELSIDDIQLLVASEDVAEAESVKFENLPIVAIHSSSKTTRPKLLNKSSVRILNKNASQEDEPRLSLPKIKKDKDGNMEIVAEILNIDEDFVEPDPKNAEPVETNVFPCPKCERTFPLVQLRDLHLKKHFRERNFQCKECDKSFFSKYDLQRHSFIHNGEKPFACSACGKAFSRSSLLTRHEKTHTDIPKYICVHCERSFISKEDMERHAERHNINRPFQCKLCNKGFAFKQGLERHEVIHARQQPFPCQYCDKSFSTTSKLHRHLTAHAGLRPYPCKFCKKSYLLSHHLTRHLRSHRILDSNMSAVNFMCSKCETGFNSRAELIKHSKTHADEQNLDCPLCKETFTDISTLITHIQEHSEGEAYACEFCDLIFITAEKLELHTDVDHAQEMEAYHADDRAQADKKANESVKKECEITDEKLQSTVNAFLIDEFSNDGNDINNPLKRKMKSEQETSPRIINQIIIRSGIEETANIDGKHKVDDNNSLLKPLKQRKIDVIEKKVASNPTRTVQQNKQSPQLKRKVLNAAMPSREANQPTIQSLLRKPEGELATRSAANTPEQKPLLIKVEKDATPSPTSTTKSTKTQNAPKPQEKKIKVQKIRVTKAEAAAMAKDGRIKIKDGKIILNT